MSGHSKWSTIKHGKAVTDARRGQLFTKLSKEIIIAVRQGGGTNPDMNVRLRMAVQRARDNNMPVDNIDRAIKRGSGESGSQDRVVEATYEGYAPGGAAIILHTLTDNRNRTVSDVRSTFSKAGGSLAETGSVAWQFEQKGVVVAEVTPEHTEELAMIAIDAGADDFEAVDSTLHIYSTPEKMEGIRGNLVEVGAVIKSSELSMLPKNTVSLDEKGGLKTLHLLDRLEELDDVQKVFSNADFPDETLERYRDES
jgi:YebC/PmpR family DNA-binding regulatory protein